MKKVLLLTLLLYSCFSFAQQASQTLRGRVIDRENTMPLMGVNVAAFLNGKLLGGAQTDEGGYYRIEQLPISRIEITVSYLGYKKSTIPNIQLTSAKEMVTNVELEPFTVILGSMFLSLGIDKAFILIFALAKTFFELSIDYDKLMNKAVSDIKKKSSKK